MKFNYKKSIPLISGGNTTGIQKLKTTMLTGQKLLLLLAVFFSLSTFAQVNLEEGLIAHYPFNGNANDESGNGNDGTVIGATLTEDRFGIENSAYYYDGNDSRINTGNGIKPSFPFTYSAWIKPDFSSSEYFVVYQSDERTNRYYGLAILCNDNWKC